MRVAQVIGRVTLNLQDPSFKGGRWLMVNPLDAGQFNGACQQAPALSAQNSLIAYDNIGACLLYTSPSPRDGLLSRMPSSA